MEFDIKNWANLSDEDRQVIIIKIAYEYDLGFKLSYNMPSGHETDNGYYSKEDNMFYFNYMLMKDDNTLATIYNLFYEIRKVMQIMNIDSTPIIQKSLNYTFMYDGSVYRNDGDIQEVYLDGERKYLKQVYIPISVVTMGEEVFSSESVEKIHLEILYQGEKIPSSWSSLWNKDILYTIYYNRLLNKA